MQAELPCSRGAATMCGCCRLLRPIFPACAWSASRVVTCALGRCVASPSCLERRALSSLSPPTSGMRTTRPSTAHGLPHYCAGVLRRHGNGRRCVVRRAGQPGRARPRIDALRAEAGRSRAREIQRARRRRGIVRRPARADHARDLGHRPGPLHAGSGRGGAVTGRMARGRPARAAGAAHVATVLQSSPPDRSAA